jgi:uncharacterized protein (DUF1499 family)
MIPAWLSLLDAVLGLMLVGAGIGAAHFGLITALFGFQMFLLGAMLAAFGLLMGLLGILRTADPTLRTGRYAAWVGVLIGLAIVIPTGVMAVRSRRFPRLDDVTTDFANPPAFMHAGQLEANQDRSLIYDRVHSEPLQQAAYGSIEPLAMPDYTPNIAFEHVKIAAGEMPDWRITWVDPHRLALEGVAVSRIFHFKEDFVIEVRPGAHGSSLIEMRSRSRDRINDLGANAHRIRAFFAMLAHRPLAPAPSPDHS